MFLNRTDSPVIGGWMMRIWPGIWTSRCAASQTALISWLRWTASITPAQTIRPHWAGERFDLHACVQALFTIKLRKSERA